MKHYRISGVLGDGGCLGGGDYLGGRGYLGGGGGDGEGAMEELEDIPKEELKRGAGGEDREKCEKSGENFKTS